MPDSGLRSSQLCAARGRVARAFTLIPVISTKSPWIGVNGRCRPFTLIELLVVISIIALLASLLLPALSSAKERVKISDCQNLMKQLHVAALFYADDNDGFCMARSDQLAAGLSDGMAWTNQIMPYHGFPAPRDPLCPELTRAIVNNSPYWDYGYTINAYLSLASGPWPGTRRGLRLEGVPQPDKIFYFGEGVGRSTATNDMRTLGDYQTDGRHLGLATGSNGVWPGRTSNFVWVDGHVTFVPASYFDQLTGTGSSAGTWSLYIIARGENDELLN